MRCPYCNTELSNDYCSKCGKKVYAPGNPIEADLTLKKKKSKVSSFLILLFLLGLFGGIFFYTINTLDKENVSDNTLNNDKEEMISVMGEYNVPKYLSGNITSKKVNSESKVYEVLDNLSELYQFENPKQEFNISSEKSENITYYRLEQIYNKIKVYGHELVMSVNEFGEVLSITGNYIPNIKISNYFTLKDNEVSNKVKEDMSDAIILSRERIIVPYTNDYLAVYLVYATDGENVFSYLINGSTGEIINKDQDIIFNINYKYSGSGLSSNEFINLDEYQDSMENKVRYRFLDNSRNLEILDGSKLNGFYSKDGNIFIGDITNGEIVISDSSLLSKDIVKTMKNYEEIYDYYYNSLGRKSYDNNGSKISVFLGVNGEEDVNAFYNPLTNQIFIGSYNDESLGNYKSLLAHEFTHGVVSTISSLGENFDKLYKNTTENQSGALSEAYSDILALLIESKSFVMAYNTPLEGIIRRDLSNPNKYLKPSKKNGENYYPNLNGKSVLKYLEDNDMKSLYEYDNGGVHTNSTVIGHAAYLTFKNEAFSSREEMAKVWYNSLFMLTPTSDFEDCALAVIKTAENFGLSENSISIIKSAFYETNILKGGSYKLSGVVKSNGKVLSNVKVSIESVDKQDMKYVKGTDKEGKYEFNDLISGNYDIMFSRTGYQDIVKRIELSEEMNLNIDMIAE